MKYLPLIPLSFFVLLFAFLATASADEHVDGVDVAVSEESPAPVVKQESTDDWESAEPEEHSIAAKVLLYFPNRILDVLDIFRVRVRVGPGVAAGVRVTEYGSVYVGGYAALYAGLPGPRMRQTPRSPIGFESHSGATLSTMDATADMGIGPEYSPTEVGAGLQLAILGFDFGIDPVEIADFLAGIFTFDIRKDDL